MDTFMKAAGLVLIAVVLCLLLSHNQKNFALLLAIAVCCMVSVAALQFLKPVIEFFDRLQKQGGWNNELLEVLLKAVGIGVLADITALICSDSGNSALGKALQFLSCAVILWISLPLFTSLMDLISQILGTI